MRKLVLTAATVFSFMLNFSYAAQSWSVDPQPTPFGIPSEESGTGAYLGVDVSDVTSDRLEALKLKEEKGVEITMVDQDAPAGKAGLKEHDVIISMNGEAIESGAQLRRMIHETPAGRPVTLGLSRDGQALTIKVQLGDRRKEFSYIAPKAKEFQFQMPPMPNMDFEVPEINVVMTHSSVRSGLMVENITPQLGEFFGVKNGTGVLIRSVEKGSRADKAGFRAGDVVVKVNGQAVHDTNDFTHALRSGSGSIGVGVMRDKREQNLNLTLPERKNSGQVLEESSEDSEVDASTELELSQLGSEIAKLRPQLELASQDALKASKQGQETWCNQKKEFEKQLEQMKEEIQPELNEELNELQREWHRDLEI
ncbi:MAG TPA: PDZ domain-containing protein [Candidatus Sulfotelmatobacter sp.]